MLNMKFDEKCLRRPQLHDFPVFLNNVFRNNYGNSFMAKFFLVTKLSCIKKRVLKPNCVVKNVDWYSIIRLFKF